MTVKIDGTKGTTSPGLYSNSTFTDTYTDGVVVDYTTGLGRISTGTSDGLAIYNGGVAGTELMRIDSSGNVGIGTSSPSSYTSGDQLVVANGSGNGQMTLAGADNGNPTLQFRRVSSPSTVRGFIQYDNTSEWLRFATNGAERMRIDSSGNLLVGTTAAGASERLAVTGGAAEFLCRFYNTNNSSPKGAVISYTSTSPNNTGNEFLYCSDSVGVRAYFKSNGGLGNYQANNSNVSDERLKTDIKPATNYLDKICAIPVVTYKYKDQTDDEPNLGVIAQSVDKVAPELVDHNGFGKQKDGETPYLSIYQTDLQYALMKAIQELSAKNDALEARLIAAEEQIIALGVK